MFRSLCASLICYLSLASAIWACCGLTVAAQAGPVTFEITKRGDARIYTNDPPRGIPEWRVLCQTPMQNCLAIHSELVFWKGRDDAFYVSLRDPAAAGLAIQSSNEIVDVPNPWAAPLDDRSLMALRHRNAELVTWAETKTVTRVAAPPVYAIARYLSWLSSEDARATQDARAWHIQKDTLSALTQDAPGDRHATLQRAHENAPSWRVPVQKPQTEFAIRAQGAETYFAKEGVPTER